VPAKGKTVARGYGKQHKQPRRLAIAAHPYCAECGRAQDLTADHIVPLSRGGKASLENYRVLCRSCNSSKADRAAPKRPVKPRPSFSRQSLNDDAIA
jgi:5-methylcytosine-specific restriction endonuclease McrA